MFTTQILFWSFLAFLAFLALVGILGDRKGREFATKGLNRLFAAIRNLRNKPDGDG